MSRHTTSTRARPSTAGSCCTRTRRRASVTAATPKATLVSRTSPCGTMPTSAATVPRCDLPYVSAGVPSADHQQHGHRPDRPGDVAQDPVDAVHQLRAHQRETPRLGGELAGVRVGAHPGGLVAARPGDHEAARQQAVAGPLADRLGLAGQQRLIGLKARAGPHHPVRDQLVPGAQVDQVAGDKVRDRDVLARAVADHADPRGAEHGEPVERALGAQLLRDADQRVGDEHDAEQGVLRLARDQDHGQQGTEDEVEPGQDVRPQDLGDRPAGALPAPVRQPARAPLGNLGAGQAGGRRLRHRRARRQRRGSGRVSHARSPRCRCHSHPPHLLGD